MPERPLRLQYIATYSLSAGMPSDLRSSPAMPRELARRDVPAHAVVGEISKRIAQCRELPIEHGKNLRLAWMKDHVIEAEVPMYYCRASLRRNILRQPGDQIVHRSYLLGLRCLVLARPTRDLTLDVVSRFSESLKPNDAEIDGVQQRNDAIQLAPDREALRFGHAGKRLVPEHPACDVVHYVKRSADNRIVLAQHIWPRHWKAGCVQRMQDYEFSVDGVRRRQQLSGRLPPQNETPAVRCSDAVGRIGLTSFELRELKGALKADYALPQIRFYGTSVEGKSLVDRLDTYELLEHQVVTALGKAGGFDVVNVRVLFGLQRTARPPDDLAVLQNTPALRHSHRTRSRNGRWNIGAATTKLTQA